MHRQGSADVCECVCATDDRLSAQAQTIFTCFATSLPSPWDPLLSHRGIQVQQLTPRESPRTSNGCMETALVMNTLLDANV